MEPRYVTPSFSQERRLWERVSTRTSWPRRSSSLRRFFTDVTTPLTAGLYQSEVMRIFMQGPSLRVVLTIFTRWRFDFLQKAEIFYVYPVSLY